MKRTFGWAVLVLLCTISTASAEMAVTRYDLHLYAKPYFDADTTIELKKRTTVTVIEKKGGWVQVEANNNHGWLRLHQIRLGDGKRKSKSGFAGLSYLWNVRETGRSGAKGITATTGIRGLDADDLKNAKPNKRAVENLTSMAATSEDAKLFAKTNGLESVSVQFLPNKSVNNSADKEI